MCRDAKTQCPAPSDGYSVAVWFHPGEFISGSANDIDPFQLVFKQKIIVVTVAYRLGIFGFFTTVDGEAPGNFGLMDQAAALRWVNRNIEQFGGNKDSVCLIGHGSGAVSATLHMTAGEWSNGMFHRIIAMSGNALTEGTVQDPKRHLRTLNRVAYLFGCFRRPTDNLIACLRNVKASTLLQQTARVTKWGPVLDAGLSNSTISFIQEDPRAMFERGQFTQVPVLIGFTDGEDALSIAGSEIDQNGIDPAHFESMLGDTVLAEMPPTDNQSCPLDNQHIVDAVSFFYSPQPPSEDPEDLRKRYIAFMTEKHFGAPSFLFALLCSRHSPTFAYRFDLKPRSVAVTSGLPEWLGVPHRLDLAFVWGVPYWGLLSDGTPWDSADKRVSDIVMIFWANFIKYTNPSKVGVYIRWDNFTSKFPGFLVIDRSFNMSHSATMNYKAFEFWNEYFPKVIDVSANCCNMTDIASTNFELCNASILSGLLICSLITFLFKYG
ncbi:neuroligin-4, X-linked-like [Ctenocephalides felis]|uniref:neuroligin-4, X-linked-like n=1 Tax=Ctenocephalides felis TaxID=7515 RepID=UPI000E6E1113|nr:neuroligin-4, X-linked-like [Ctenocephalides felis]